MTTITIDDINKANNPVATPPLYECCGNVEGRSGNAVAVFYGISKGTPHKPFLCVSGTPSIHALQFQMYGELCRQVKQTDDDYLSCDQVVAKIQEMKPEWQVRVKEDLRQLPSEWFQFT